MTKEGKVVPGNRKRIEVAVGGVRADEVHSKENTPKRATWLDDAELELFGSEGIDKAFLRINDHQEKDDITLLTASQRHQDDNAERELFGSDDVEKALFESGLDDLVADSVPAENVLYGDNGANKPLVNIPPTGVKETNVAITEADLFPEDLLDSIFEDIPIDEMFVANEASPAIKEESKIMNALNRTLEKMKTSEEPKCDIGAISLRKAGGGVVGDCPICTCEIAVEERAVFTSCDHLFCVTCSLAWAAYNNVCPMCRAENFVIRIAPNDDIKKEKILSLKDFSQLLKKNKRKLDVKYMVEVEAPKAPEGDDLVEDLQDCMVCRGTNDQDLLLLCDFCDEGYHTLCIDLGTYIPPELWYCDNCFENGCLDTILDTMLVDQSQQERRAWRRNRIKDRRKLEERRNTNRQRILDGLPFMSDGEEPNTTRSRTSSSSRRPSVINHPTFDHMSMVTMMVHHNNTLDSPRSIIQELGRSARGGGGGNTPVEAFPWISHTVTPTRRTAPATRRTTTPTPLRSRLSQYRHHS